ncbi:MAG: hypothetical protein JXL80_06210 [Planctomycetes bacterium]|nr:hypothetical protein [Planctomycetota bacterium]
MKSQLLVWASVAVVGIASVLAAQATDPSAEYKTRAAALKDDDASGHFELAKWALEQSLYSEVTQEANKLQALDQGDERAKYLKKAAQFYASGNFVLPAEESSETDVAKQPDGTTADGNGTTTGDGTTTPPAGGPKKAIVYQLSDDEAAEIFKNVGDPMQNFQVAVQPILIRSCARADCHGGTGNGTELYLEAQRRTDRKTVAANYKSLDRYINHTDLSKSRLLKIVLAEKSEHPGGPVFRSDRDAGYQRLKQWVESLKEGIW